MAAAEDFMEGVRIRISRRARRLALRLDAGARVVHLVVPHRMSLKKAYAFAHEHEAWIRERLSALPRAVSFDHGTVLPLLGRDVRIAVTFDETLKSTRIALTDGELRVHTNKPDPSARIHRFLVGLARKEITERVRKKCARTGKVFRSVQIRDTRSRWGSCGEDGRLSFSWRLIFAPPAALDYVVAHEVAHLSHLDHSRAFWSLCRSLSDDYLEGHHWMQANGAELMRYGQNFI